MELIGFEVDKSLDGLKWTMLLIAVGDPASHNRTLELGKEWLLMVHS